MIPRSAARPAVTQLVGNITKPSLQQTAKLKPNILKTSHNLQNMTSYGLSKFTPRFAASVTKSIASSMQVRYAHTDVQVPNFRGNRRQSVMDERSRVDESDPSRKMFSYVMVGGTAAVGLYAAKGTVNTILDAMSISADVKALATIEVDLSAIPEGSNVMMKWRGKPIFVKHRTHDEITDVRNTDLSTLRDPQDDRERVKKDEWLVVLGVCTHLGCIPKGNQGDYGGYYCPCHGSHYDNSGRIRKGPAPLNLEVPIHEFKSDNLLVVG